MSADEPLKTQTLKARYMPDFWTGEGAFHPNNPTGAERWIGRRAGDGAPVLIIEFEAEPSE